MKYTIYLILFSNLFVFIFPERNDQTEQEERREIKQRLNRKVKMYMYFEAFVLNA